MKGGSIAKAVLHNRGFLFTDFHGHTVRVALPWYIGGCLLLGGEQLLKEISVFSDYWCHGICQVFKHNKNAQNMTFWG